MAGIYKIGSKLGYELVNGMKPGDSVTATDGSVWTMGQDGSISVLKNGQTMVGQVTYQPTRQESVGAMPGSGGYKSPYAEQIQNALAGLQDAKWEGWDKDQDESYQAYRKEYLREADRTMKDTLGQYSQNTGGIAGSSAIAAASQAADYYKSKLSDKVPELYENAYARYLNDVQNQRQNLGMMMDAENMSHSQYYQNIQYAMNKWNQMGYADQEVADILGVGAGTPTSDQSYTDWSTAFKDREYADQQAAAAAKAAYSSGGGGNGGSGGAVKEPEVKKQTETITSPSQLSPAALNLLNGMSKVNSYDQKESFANRIESMLASGTITEAEADFLLKAMGY